MAELEKVIQGLDCCLAVKNAGTKTCFDCHYKEKDGHLNTPCEDYLMADALELLKWQAGTIRGLEQSLKETLDVVSGQKNVGRCNECKKRLTMNCWCDYMARRNPEWFCAGFEPSDEAIENALGEDG